MSITELFIRRPVMTVLLNVAVVVAGLLALDKIPVAALPRFDTPTINVSADLPGASPETMASSVALPLEKQFSTIAGLSLISSSSSLGNTSLTLEFDATRDIDAAALDVQAALFRAQRSLPEDMTTPPSYRKVNPADAPVLFVALTSPSIGLTQLNDYAENLISPSLSTLEGVAQVSIYGQRRFAVRVEVDLDRLAERNLTLDELRAVLTSANANTPVGTLDGPRQTLTVQANRQLMNAKDWRQVIVATRNGAPVRLADVAQVQDSVESTKTYAELNGEPSITLAIQRQPDANTVQVVDRVKAMLPRFAAQLPASVKMTPVNDRSRSIREAVHDVYFTLALTVVLVVMVIFLFLRRLSATLIPSFSLPISLIGALALLWAGGYSLDNISLLGITLAVGLVVDDAIVMLENIVRHVEDGMEPFAAAVRGAREMSFTILSISISLVAVLIPIFFMPGVMGMLFHEFAVVVGLSILVSAAVSLTLVPMLCSRYLKHEAQHEEGWLGRTFEAGFTTFQNGYGRTLDWALRHRWLMGGVALGSLVLTLWMAVSMPKGFFPEEDIGQIRVSTEASQDISFDAMMGLQAQVAAVFRADPNVATVSSFLSGGNAGRLFINLKPRGERPAMPQVVEQLRKKLRGIAGIQAYMAPVQNLQLGGRQSKSRYQYTLQSVSADDLNTWAQKLEEKLAANTSFRDVTSDAQNKGLQAQLVIDRDKANLLGVQLADVRSALYSAFGERQVSTMYGPANSFSVIMEASQANREFEQAFDKVWLRSKAGNLVPLSAVANVQRTLGPVAVNHQGQLQSVTIAFNLAPGVPLSVATQAIDQAKAALDMPPSLIGTYGGDAAVFQQSQGSQIVLIVAALAVIYVLLGVLYESYIHPLTILAGLPSAAIGALLALKLFNMELTLIASIGILMLIGIVKKNAIMMIDFALDAQRHQGMSPPEAIRAAALLRLRPIMMTTVAALMGALPIALGMGAGAELRQPLGLAVVGGLILSQVVTLYITPVIYLALDRWAGNGPITTEVAEAASRA